MGSAVSGSRSSSTRSARFPSRRLPFSPLLKILPGRPDGHCGQGLHHGDLLLRPQHRAGAGQLVPPHHTVSSMSGGSTRVSWWKVKGMSRSRAAPAGLIRAARSRPKVFHMHVSPSGTHEPRRRRAPPPAPSPCPAGPDPAAGHGSSLAAPDVPPVPAPAAPARTSTALPPRRRCSVPAAASPGPGPGPSGHTPAGR